MNEYIVKYNGDIYEVDSQAEILNHNYAIIEKESNEIKQLYDYKQIEYIESSKKLFVSLQTKLDYCGITQTKEQNTFGLNGNGVIIGIIDSGIDTNHKEFVDDKGNSRILYLWDMDKQNGNIPKGFRFGTEYTNFDIDKKIVKSEDIIGHGTAVAGIATGNSGVANKSNMIIVKLGIEGTRTTNVMRGIKYIIDKAQNLNMPCVINLSYGTNEGSHTGQSLFESYIDDMAGLWKTVIVCATGNEGYGGHHFSQKLSNNVSLKVDFSVVSQRNNIYLTIWKNIADTVNYELLSPSGKTTEKVTSTYGKRNIVLDGINVSILYGQPTHYSMSQEIYLQIEKLWGDLNGIWTLICHGEKITDGKFDVWLPTIEEVSDRTAFLNPCPEFTITLPATSKHVISVGGYRADSGIISPFSGRGNTVCNGNVKPDLVAPAENIYTARTGGGYGVFTGTSMAAPFVTGAVALMMEWGIVKKNDPFLYGQRIKAFLCRNALRYSYYSYPNSIWGYGNLNLYNTLDDMINNFATGLILV